MTGAAWLASLLTAAALQPLPAQDARLFRRSAEDELTKEVCDGDRRVTRTCRDVLSYITSNEKSEFAFAPHIRELGGGYLGIGADQNYTFIGWARPELVWLMDYDPNVAVVHRIHKALILAAETPADFRRLWSAPERGEVVRALGRVVRDREERRQHLDAYREYRRKMTRSFNFNAEHDRTDAPYWLEDAASYGYVRQLYLTGRIRILGGDLLDKRSVRGIARVAKRLNVPVRLVYLSNAEEFWKYPPAFRRNMRALPMDGRSRILRTRASEKFSALLGDKFSYVVQSGQAFQEGLGDRSIRYIDDFLAHGRIGDNGELLVQLGPSTPSGTDNAATAAASARGDAAKPVGSDETTSSGAN